MRLAHLFESATFRLKFRRYGAYLIMSNWAFVHVHALPDDCDTWFDQRCKQVEVNDRLKSKRPALYYNLRSLLMHDNGDPSSSKFIHWSLVGGREAEVQAMKTMIGNYLAIFGEGFPTPLLYRWKHGEISQRYTRDTWLC